MAIRLGIRLLLGSILLLTIGSRSDAQQRGASVSLRAKWEGTSVLLEAAEFLADEGLPKFWNFVEAVDRDEIAEGSKSCWSRILHHASRELTEMLSQVLRSFVSLRYHSPRLEMFRTLAASSVEDACCWVEMGDLRFTEAEGLKEAVSDAAASGQSEALYEFDHLFVPGSQDLPGAVLYGAPGTQCFSTMHKQLSGMAADGSIRYALRPYLARGCPAGPGNMSECLQLGTGEALPLPGYGVELAIKNMEYKAMDDSEIKAKGHGSQAEEEGLEGAEVAGFLFKTLMERKPEAVADLVAFQEHLLNRQTSAEEETLKVWDLKDLGLQAVQRVSSSNDPLRLLADVSQNFPSLASSLSRLEVDPALRAEVKRIQQSLPSGTNFLLLNGLMVNVDTLELYSLVERVRHDMRLSEHLVAAGIPRESIKLLLAQRPSLVRDDGDEIRVDLGDKVLVKFLNNLEKDRMYSGWQSSLRALLMPSFGGQMMPIARNIFTAIFFADPGSKDAFAACQKAQALYTRGLPIRIGMVLLPRGVQERVVAQVKGQGEARTPDWEDVDVPERIARAFHMLHKTFGPVPAFGFLASLGSAVDEDPYGYNYGESEDEYAEAEDEEGQDLPSWEAVSAKFAEFWSAGGSKASTKKGRLAAKLPAEDAMVQLAEGTAYAEGVADEVVAAARFALGRGLIPGAGGVLLWFNGIVYEQHVESALMMALQQEMQNVQFQVYQGLLTDGSNVAVAILKNAGAVPRYNPAILGKASDEAVGSEGGEPPAVREVSLPVGGDLPPLHYLMHEGTHDTVHKVTHWVVGDIDTHEGRSLALAAAKYVAGKKSSQARVALLHCPAASAQPLSSRLARLVIAVAASGSETDCAGCAQFLISILGPDGTAATEAMNEQQDSDTEAFGAALSLAEAAGIDIEAVKGHLMSGMASQEAGDAYTAAVCGLVRSDLNMAAGQHAVVTNGRLVPNSGLVGGLTAEDFELMSLYAKKSQAVDQVAEALRTSGASPSAGSDHVMLASGLLRRLGLRDDMKTDETSLRLAAVVGQLRSKAGALLEWDPPGGSQVLDVIAVVDPLTSGAQKLVSLLLYLRSSFAPRLRVWLNPRLDLSELPLKSFFRFALPQLQSAADAQDDEMPGAPEALFLGLPQKKILTLNIHPPEAWLVEPVLAFYDTDNLLLSELPEGDNVVTADYELEALMITGSCIDVSATSREKVTPRGVQLHLGDVSRPHVSDTLVMSNLGYFQLKSAPGVWSLSLAPGATSALYTIHSSSGISEGGRVQTADASAATMVVVSSMNGKHMHLKLKKKPGHEDDDVLAYELPELEANAEPGEIEAASPSEALEESPSPAPSGLWGKLMSVFGSDRGPKQSPALPETQSKQTVNIFTVASGHMYERLQKIMILSVLRHTSAPVKFWFIKNYMSPQMKAFLPHYARAYGFEYELVTYKWPRWLHKQTEKQRIIWAYKILFLDVLFPLDLKKVVFVDADQIIRTDLRQLVDMDLKGAPYAYTPFCDNNKDMDGYRFWKQGFWKDHLRGRPYHISALYVVDLERFRQTAAGDQLRIIYDGLSKDPNSLANLDQDLPNYAQHQVKIHSLPQEWLWCESWCGNATKSKAKTIDLCNNPMTKEPKLHGARRIVSEWPAYDEEVIGFTSRVEAILGGDDPGNQDEGRPLAPDPAGSVAASELGGHDDTEL